MFKFIASFLVRKYGKEYVKEFRSAHLGEKDEGFYTWVGDKHYFEFEVVKGKIKLLNITDIVYW